jgi:3-oxoacyl-[acyl-carrier protein] reductase
MMPKDDFTLITGCLSGIGKVTLEYCCSNGLNVIAGVLYEDEEFLQYCRDLELQYSIKIIVQVFDLGSEEQIKASVKRLFKEKVTISGLVNIAGITKDASALMASSIDLRTVLNVNLVGQILLTQYVLRLMLKTGGGSVVFISSITGIDGNSGQLAYGVSKAGLINACKTFSREFGAKGVNFNVVAPGVINTQMNDVVPAEILEERLNSTSLKRIGEPQEISKVIYFLISDKSKHITGQVVRVDGGMR